MTPQQIKLAMEKRAFLGAIGGTLSRAAGAAKSSFGDPLSIGIGLATGMAKGPGNPIMSRMMEMRRKAQSVGNLFGAQLT